MNDYQSARLDSFKAVTGVCDNDQESMNKVPGFAKGIVKLKAIITDIEDTREIQETDNTGITDDKNLTLEKLEDDVLDVGGAVFAWAEDKGDHETMAKVNYKSSVVDDMDQNQLLAAAGIVYAEALKVPAADLDENGISAEELQAFGVLVKFFSDTKEKKRGAVIDTSDATQKLASLFKQATRLFRNKLDKLATQFKSKAPEFYLKYRAARNVIYPRGGSKGSNGGDDKTE